MNKDEYYRDLKERQRKHLERLQNKGPAWRPCLHEQCPNCHGTGIGQNGACVHGIACPCPKCSSWS